MNACHAAGAVSVRAATARIPPRLRHLRKLGFPNSRRAHPREYCRCEELRYGHPPESNPVFPAAMVSADGEV